MRETKLEKMFESELVERLNEIISATEAHIVLSSSWRGGFRTLSDIDSFFKKIGINSECHDITPVCYYTCSRGDEIQLWLRDNSNFIENFIILDDDTNMGDLTSNLVHVNGAHGISEENVAEAINKLNGVRNETY